MIGTELGPYRILGKLGEGGMGQVYRARDNRLDRDVALKVLPGTVVDDPDRLKRFEREAKTLAALNHPNIAAIYGIETDGPPADGGATRPPALVMELVEGEDLARRLRRGPLGVDAALAIARQVIAALESAHDTGIAHRDLKPANIMITPAGTVKVLDFGIAKALTPPDANPSNETTTELTSRGALVGTSAYMSPEQARGQRVDGRTDIYSFGSVLFEMLAGRRAFTGDTTADVLAAVVTRDPDWQALPASTPPAIVRLLKRCMEKDPARRLRHIADARFAIDDATATSVDAEPTRHRPWIRGWMVPVAFVGGAALTFGSWALRPAPGETRAAEAVVTGMPEPPGESLYLFVGPIAISPDGTRVVLVTNSPEGKSRLWLRVLSEAGPRPLDGTEGGMFPFWSPDSRSIGFLAQGQLKVIDLASRAVRTLVPVPGPLGGGTWNHDGIIVYASVAAGLQRVPASGGTPTSVTTLDPSKGEVFHAAPCFLPDGRHFLYFVNNARAGDSAVMIGALDSPDSTRLLSAQTSALYAAPGYLLYGSGSELLAQRFDERSLSVLGDPVTIGDGLWMWNSGGLLTVSAASDGLLMFAARRTTTTRLSWFDRAGRPGATVGEPGEWVHVSLSPDERTVAAERLEARRQLGTVWMLDISGGTASRLTADPAWALAPVWSPDGRRVAFGSSRDGASDLYTRAGDGSGQDEVVLKSNTLKVPTDWTRDGRIFFNNIGGAGGDIWAVAAGGDHRSTALVEESSSEGSGKVSPDGRWLAYTSNETGRPEVYVRSLTGGGRRAISRSGGWQPRWRRDGTELFFLSADSTLMAVRVTTGKTFISGEPQALPITAQPDVTGWRYSYDVTGDGQRFLVIRSAGVDPTPPITVVTNWTALLKQ